LPCLRRLLMVCLSSVGDVRPYVSNWFHDIRTISKTVHVWSQHSLLLMNPKIYHCSPKHLLKKLFKICLIISAYSHPIFYRDLFSCWHCNLLFELSRKKKPLCILHCLRDFCISPPCQSSFFIADCVTYNVLRQVLLSIPCLSTRVSIM